MLRLTSRALPLVSLNSLLSSPREAHTSGGAPSNGEKLRTSSPTNSTSFSRWDVRRSTLTVEISRSCFVRIEGGNSSLATVSQKDALAS